MDSTTTNTLASSFCDQSAHTNICHFPVELMINIFQFLDYNDLRKCTFVNKQFHAILGPRSSTAQPCWRGYRRRLNLPDPAVFGFTEYQFFSKLDQPRSTCDFCKSFTNRIREWAFHGHCMCSQCFKQKTVQKHYLVDCMNDRQFSYIPELQTLLIDDRHRYETFVFRTDIIHDHIPDDAEIEELTKRKIAIENAARLMARNEFSNVVLNYERDKRNKCILNVYNWLLYKYPMLTRKELELLPELGAELKKTTSIDTVADRQHFERVTIEALKKKNETIVLPRFQLLLESSSRPAYDFEHWKMYDPFWKDGLLARLTLPSTQDIVTEMEKHFAGFQEYLELKHQRFALMFNHASDLSMEDIKALMTTEEFENVQEDEFADRCRKIRNLPERERKRDLTQWEVKYGVADIRFPSLIQELESDPNFRVDNEAAAIGLVSRLRDKQTELIKRAKEQIRKQCGNDEVYDLVMAELSSSVYFEFTKQSVVLSRGIKWKRLNNPDLFLLKCRECFESFNGLHSAMAHATTHGEDLETILISQDWVERIELGMKWIPQTKYGRWLDNSGKVIAIRTFPHWGDSSNYTFLRFQTHIEDCKVALSTPRYEYESLINDVKRWWPSLLNPENEEIFQEKTRKLLAIPTYQRSLKTKKEFIVSQFNELLSKRSVNFQNPRFLSECIRREFQDSYFPKILTSLHQRSSDNTSQMLTHNLDRLVCKWKPVDDLCLGIFDEIMGTVFGNAVRDWYGDRGEVIEKDDLQTLVDFVRHFPETREWAFAEVKERVSMKCQLPPDFLKNSPIFCWKKVGKWIRCSLVELVNKHLVVHHEDLDHGFNTFEINDIDGEFFVIGMQLNWMNEPDVLKL